MERCNRFNASFLIRKIVVIWLICVFPLCNAQEEYLGIKGRAGLIVVIAISLVCIVVFAALLYLLMHFYWRKNPVLIGKQSNQDESPPDPEIGTLPIPTLRRENETKKKRKKGSRVEELNSSNNEAMMIYVPRAYINPYVINSNSRRTETETWEFSIEETNAQAIYATIANNTSGTTGPNGTLEPSVPYLAGNTIENLPSGRREGRRKTKSQAPEIPPKSPHYAELKHMKPTNMSLQMSTLPHPFPGNEVTGQNGIASDYENVARKREQDDPVVSTLNAKFPESEAVPKMIHNGVEYAVVKKSFKSNEIAKVPLKHVRRNPLANVAPDLVRPAQSDGNKSFLHNYVYNFTFDEDNNGQKDEFLENW